MNATTSASILGLVIAPSLAAQALEPYRCQASPTDTAYFQVSAIRDSAIGVGHSFCGFQTAGGDSVFEFGWAYRVDGESRNYAFHDGPGAQTLSTPQTYDFGPPETGLELGTMAIEWSNVDGKGFGARWDIAVAQLAPDRATAVHSMTVHNPGAAPLTIDVFLYADLDVSGFYDFDNRSRPDGGFMLLDNTSSYVHLAPNPAPTHWEVDEFYDDLDGRIFSGAPYDLGDTGLPFPNGDWTGAFQWRLTVPAMSSAAVDVTLGRNVCPNPSGTAASLTSYGTATPRAAGPLRVAANRPPYLGSTFELFFGNGPSNGSMLLLLGSQQISLPFCGIELLVLPWADLTLPLDPVGSGSLAMRIYCDPNLIGVNVCAQVLAVDPTGPSTCFPIVGSDGLKAVVGS